MKPGGFKSKLMNALQNVISNLPSSLRKFMDVSLCVSQLYNKISFVKHAFLYIFQNFADLFC